MKTSEAAAEVETVCRPEGFMPTDQTRPTATGMLRDVVAWPTARGVAKGLVRLVGGDFELAQVSRQQSAGSNGDKPCIRLQASARAWRDLDTGMVQ